MSAEGHDARCKTLLINVTDSQRFGIKSFREGCWRSSFFMSYSFGVIKTDLEKAFKLPGAPPLEPPQKLGPGEPIETELSTVLFEHPGV